MITYRNKRRRNRINNRLNHTEMKQSNVNMRRLIAIVVSVVLGVSLISCKKDIVEPEIPLEEIEIKVTAMFYPVTGDYGFISDDTPVEHYLDDTATPLRVESVFTSAIADNNWEFVKGEVNVVVSYAFREYFRDKGYGEPFYYVVLAMEGTEGLEGTKPDSEWIDNYFEGITGGMNYVSQIVNHSFKYRRLDQKPSQIYYKAEHLYRYNESELVYRFNSYPKKL